MTISPVTTIKANRDSFASPQSLSLHLTFSFLLLLLSTMTVKAEPLASELSDLKNLQVHGNLFSSGLPDEAEFVALKKMGVTQVIDLIPGDRSDEQALVKTLGLKYNNIAVDWENPTLANFESYVKLMGQTAENEKVLTHCKLNWRGATFTYLYRVTQLNVSEPQAKKAMLEIWQPNATWQAFIDNAMAKYSTPNH